MRKNIKRSGRVFQIDTTRLVGERLTRGSAELLFAAQYQCCGKADISLTRRCAATRLQRREPPSQNQGIPRATAIGADDPLKGSVQLLGGSQINDEGVIAANGTDLRTGAVHVYVLTPRPATAAER
jgi:hypothetical protein